MTRDQAIQEERERYLSAILAGWVKLARLHLKVLHRLAGNGYTNWNHERDGVV